MFLFLINEFTYDILLVMKALIKTLLFVKLKIVNLFFSHELICFIYWKFIVLLQLKIFKIFK